MILLALIGACGLWLLYSICARLHDVARMGQAIAHELDVIAGELSKANEANADDREQRDKERERARHERAHGKGGRL